jgi:aspartyl-tRNA(Asn)/glutamyl-tRNA(Gln) amidotransferase subunit C
MLSEHEFEKLCKLSRLECKDEGEKKAIQNSLSSILSHMDALKEVETSGVEPCLTVLETLSNVLRDDIPEPSLSRELFLSNSPSHVGGMIKVPPVLKQEP